MAVRAGGFGLGKKNAAGYGPAAFEIITTL